MINSCFTIRNRCNVLRHFSRDYRKGSGVRSNNNVGIKKRLAIFSQENPDLENMRIDERILDEIETELDSSKALSDFYRRNVEKVKMKTEFKTIERKYFDKIKLPNFLTWSEKEQIKELHKNEPTLWTCDKLSRSFPATPNVIHKIIENNWKPESRERILKHDKQVSKNWEMLKKGELELEPDLAKHLSTFSSRESVQHSEENAFVAGRISSPSRQSEFTNIVSPDYDNDNLKSENMSSNVRHNEDQSTMTEMTSLQRIRTKMTIKSRKEIITLDELRNKTKDIIANSSTLISKSDEAFLKGSDQKMMNTLTDIDDIENVSIKKLNIKSNLVKIKETKSNNDLDDAIPMKITLPKNVPKASVYRIKDIYYDTDGQFLYRVPGMKGS